MSYVMEILHVSCSANGAGLGICGPLNYLTWPDNASARPYAEGTCGSLLCSKGDLGWIEHKMTSNWPSDTTAPR